ncbi:mitofusin-1-like [Corticium candelabrum]|uniref:mitofusin-1-like n=1 Tax=Corticium candelabrum TaxID=121492 RepID=UPI002E262AF0|nr:mitofusin-1-like [Corticium candelabrum]
MSEHRQPVSLQSSHSFDNHNNSTDARKYNRSQSVSSNLKTLKSPTSIRQSEVSPLRRFGLAKSEATDLFKRLSDHLTSARDLYSKPSQQDEYDELERWRERAIAICDVIGRDAMKVAFFGRTSNGKSTVINAMLHQSILPSGIGHTTNCFCAVKGSSCPDAPYLVTPESDEKRNVETVQQLAHALHRGSSQKDLVIKVYWPRERCTLLKEDVELLDSPGIDISPDSDMWIDKVCLDADVFVLISNAESTLMNTEKKFFHKVSEKLSKPNIFILNNRWDASAGEDSQVMAEVREQHLQRGKDFLCKELKVVDPQQAGDRVFFVSAKEALEERTKGPGSVKADGFKGRLAEFESFERKFEECLSKSAISTKFKQHAMKGIEISKGTHEKLDQLERSSNAHRVRCKALLEKRRDELERLVTHRVGFATELDGIIRRTGEGVESMVDSAMREEISNLNRVVNAYTAISFTADNVLTFVEGLYSHVDDSLDRNLMACCNTSVSQTLRQTQQQLLDSVQSAIPEDMRLSPSIISKEDISLSYELDCRQLCTGFSPDLQFRFSWGLVLMRRWLGQDVVNYYTGAVVRATGSSTGTETSHSSQEMQQSNTSLLTWAVAAVRSPGLYSSWPVIAIVTLTWQSIGWKVVAMAGTAVACLYGYERLCWTNKAREKSLKQQFVSFAADRLQLVVAVKSKDCKQQVQRELQHSVVQLNSTIDQAKEKLETEILQLENDIQQHQQAENQAREYKNTMNFFKSELHKFMKDFQLHDS